MTLEFLFIAVMVAGLVLPIVAIIAGLSLEVFGDPTRDSRSSRLSQTALTRLINRHNKRSSARRFWIF